MYNSDEQLHPMELCSYICIIVKVDSLDGERISQIRGCTGRQNWHGWDRRNDCVWVKSSLGRCYGAQNGRLRCLLQLQFKIKLLDENGVFFE